MSRGNDYVPVAVRKRVALQAAYACEYCLFPDSETLFGCEIDHIISLKHGGASAENNLAYACPAYNRNKGSDIASIDWDANQAVRLFNPRTDLWSEHVQFVGNRIESITTIGLMTVRILRFNDDNRLNERDYTLYE